MKMQYTVSPIVVDWMINQVESREALVDPLRILKEWRDGVRVPTFNEIHKVAKKTHIPLGYFFLERPPKEKLELLEYRTIISSRYEKPSRELLDTITDMEQIVDWTRSYLQAENFEPNPIVGKLRGQTDKQTIANFIRDVLGLSLNWFKETETPFSYIREKISQAGAIVMMNGVVRSNTHRALDINEFRAFAIIDQYAPLIFINATDSHSGRIFSLLHEFVHICLGNNNLFNDRYGSAKTETLCNAVTTEILVPTTIFDTEWERFSSHFSSTDKVLDKIASYFKCGRVVIARRALDSGRINQAKYNEIVQKAIKDFSQLKKEKKERGDYYRTKGSRIDSRFLSFVADSVSQGKTLYSEAFRLTDTTRLTFFELIDRINA
jgi:Zn-dependent peptidase ImmA (M78 family)